MTEVTIRELRNHGGAVVARVTSGEHITITRDGTPVAELRPLPRRRVATTVLIQRRRQLPAMDPQGLRDDIDAIVDTSL